MVSPTLWTWVCVSSGSWWWTGRPGMLQSTGSQRVRHDWASELMCLINMKCLCLQMALPRLVCGCTLFNWIKRNHTHIWILRKLKNLPTSWWMTVLSIIIILRSGYFPAAGVCIVCCIWLPPCTWPQGYHGRGAAQDCKGHVGYIEVEYMIRPPKMAVLLLSGHPLSDQWLLYLLPTFSASQHSQ